MLGLLVFIAVLGAALIVRTGRSETVVARIGFAVFAAAVAGMAVPHALAFLLAIATLGLVPIFGFGL